MSVWTRLFGQSEQKPATSEPRLGLELLETREVPAIVFVGGWGASMYQYAHNDPASAGIPSVTDLVLDPFNPTTTADGRAADYSAIAFVGGWGSSATKSGPGSLGMDVHVVHRADPLPVLMVLADRQDFYSTTGGSGRDVLLGGVNVDAAADPTTVADDVVVDGRVITGENYNSATIASSGYIRIKKLNSGG